LSLEQELVTDPYPEPDESGLYHPILFIWDQFSHYPTIYV
jgi:hypothetical protein